MKTEGEDPEECDDANTVNTDECLNSCQESWCGDGFVEAGVEQCDDGNNVNTDGCLNDCTISVCGDGVRQTSGDNVE